MASISIGLIFEVRAGRDASVRKVPGKVYRAKVANVIPQGCVLETPADTMPFEIGCTVAVVRGGECVGEGRPSRIDRQNGVVCLAGLEAIPGDVLEVVRVEWTS